MSSSTEAGTGPAKRGSPAGTVAAARAPKGPPAEGRRASRAVRGPHATTKADQEPANPPPAEGRRAARAKRGRHPGPGARPDLSARAARIRLLVLDVDGVMTDGGITIGSDGSETKTFHVRDGHGIKLLQRAGIEVAIISGRRSAATALRASELGISIVHQGAFDKVAAFDAVLAGRGISPDRVAYVGDDVVDLPVLRRAGLAIAVGDAADDLAPYMHYNTGCNGGRGAVREVAELLLRAQGRWGEMLRQHGAGPAAETA